MSPPLKLLCLTTLLLSPSFGAPAARTGEIEPARFQLNGAAADPGRTSPATLVDAGSQRHVLIREGRPSVVADSPPNHPAAGKSSLHFDGKQDRYTLSNSIVGTDDSFVLEAWAAADQANAPGLHGVATVGDGARGYTLGQEGGQWIVFVGGVGASKLGPVIKDQWAHLAVMVDGTGCKFFLNGTMVATGVRSLGLTPLFTMGDMGRGKECFAGKIHDVRLTPFQAGGFDSAADLLLDYSKVVVSPAPVPAPYINTWRVSDAQVADADADARAGGTPVRYFDDRLFSRNYDDYQDLRSYIGWIRKEKTAAIAITATTCVWSPAAQAAELWMGADQECRAWVNQEIVGESKTDMPDRDQLKWKVSLKQGWNTLAVRVANRNEGRLGFYARLCTPDGHLLPGLLVSPEGGAGKLRTSTQPLDKAAGNPLPIAWRAWPYVAMEPLDTVPKQHFVAAVISRRAHASPFLLSAAGGQPPYRWQLTAGTLPKGLALRLDGAIIGTPEADAKVGPYPFTVGLTDAAGATIDRKLSLELRERPNKRLEEGRLVGLIHRPEHAPNDGTPGNLEKELDDFAKLMKRQGYYAGIVIGYNNGPGAYHWPTRTGFTPLNPAGPPVGDLMRPYQKALTDNGVKFGF